MLATNVSGIDRVRALATDGESDLAAIEAIRMIASWGVDIGSPEAEVAARQSVVLSDLGVLRHAAADRQTALTCLRTALVLDESNALAHA